MVFLFIGTPTQSSLSFGSKKVLMADRQVNVSSFCFITESELF